MGMTVAQRERKYDLRDGDLALLMQAQDERCAICRESEAVPGRSLAIDHNHETGQVRGLLCGRCNQTIGRMEDSAALLRRAADYLDNALKMFPDSCERCLDGEANYPCGIVKDAPRTRFIYRCKNNHTWTCNYATKGLGGLYAL